MRTESIRLRMSRITPRLRFDRSDRCARQMSARPPPRQRGRQARSQPRDPRSRSAVVPRRFGHVAASAIRHHDLRPAACILHILKVPSARSGYDSRQTLSSQLKGTFHVNDSARATNQRPRLLCETLAGRYDVSSCDLGRVRKQWLEIRVHELPGPFRRFFLPRFVLKDRG
jgi:hypothetical protein